jgi:hypothetical protein
MPFVLALPFGNACNLGHYLLQMTQFDYHIAQQKKTQTI